MKMYFVRHGETGANKQGSFTDHNENSLTALTNEGIEQASKISLEIRSDFSEIYSSDLIRCKQTAEIINEKLKLPIIYDTRLRERNFGSLQGKTWKEVGQDLRELDKNQKYDYRSFGGESVDDVKNRIMSFIEEIKNTKPKRKILVVTSSGIIRLLHNILNNVVQEKIHNSSIHEFYFED